MAENQSLSGVGGWLSFLVIVLMIFGPLIGFGRTSNEFRDALEQFPQLADNVQWKSYKQVIWLIFTASAITSFAAGYRLWKTHFPESVSFAILALWLIGPLTCGLYGIAAVVIFGNNGDGSFFTQVIGGVVSTSIMAGVWTAYLSNSQRVRNTYQYNVYQNNEASREGTTPLMMAAMLGKTKQMQELISTGADLDAIDERGWTALMYAANGNEAEAIEILVKGGANQALKNNESQTAAEIAKSKAYHAAATALQS